MKLLCSWKLCNDIANTLNRGSSYCKEHNEELIEKREANIQKIKKREEALNDRRKLIKNTLGISDLY